MLGAIIGLIIGTLTSKSIFFILLLLLPLIKWHKDHHKLIIFLLCFTYGLLISLLAKANTFSNNAYLLVIEAKENYVIARNLFSKCYILVKGNDLEIGDIIKVDGIVKELDMHAIESHFDFKNYLNNNGIYYEFSVGKMEKILSLFFPIKKIAILLTNKYDALTSELAKSLVFGYSSKTINSLFSNNSFRYMLTLNSSILAFEMYLIVNLFKKTKPKAVKIVICIIGSLLFILLFFKKALLKFLLFMVAKKLRKEKQLSLIKLSELIILIYLIISPFNFYSYGIWYTLIIANYFNLCLKKEKNKAIYMAILLIILNYVFNGYIPLTLSIMRIVLQPVILIYELTIMLLMFMPIHINLQTYSKGIIWLLNIAKNFDFSFYPIDSLILKLIIIALYIVFLYFVNIKYNKFSKNIFLIMSLILTIFSLPINNYIYDYLYAIDVGQGDCSLIVHKNKTVLIDTGGLTYEDIAVTTLIPFFKKVHVNKIDYVICSHSDHDHIGALDSLKQLMKVKNIINERSQFPLNVNGLIFENLNNYDYKNENDSSLVNKFTFIGLTFLYMGDASTTIEKKIVNDYDLSDVDIIKLGHHGSSTSTSEEFLDATTPKEVIISLGHNNYYGFPNKVVLERLNKRNIKIRRSDIEGTIIYKKLVF